MEAPSHYMPDDLISTLQKQHYALFGHSAVKLCHWSKAALTKNQYCYKNKFYGIESHRCMQFTPAVAFCTQKCLYCWRPLNTTGSAMEEFDSPKEIVQESIKQQRILLSGFGSLIESIGKKKLMEAQNPRHVAISLAGEPTAYPKISELIAEYKKSGLSTFLVTNGANPEALAKMKMPTQLYVSLSAPDEALHKKINQPIIRDSWKRFNETLELLPELKTRKAVRITLIKGMNMHSEKEYAQLIQKANPDFVELKSYMHVGFSRLRLQRENMPTFAEVKEFSEKLNKHLQYNLADSDERSRVALLWNGKTKKKIKFEE